MGKVTQVANLSTGTVARTAWNEAMETVETDNSLTGTGLIGDPLSVEPTFADDEFMVQNVSDSTKQIALDASGITTATTRTITMPDNDVDLGDIEKYRLESIIISCSDLTTDLAVGTTVAYFRMPYAFTLTDVRASVLTAPTGSALTVDINETATTILSTKITIDATEKTSVTAATAPVISDTSLADDAEITIDIDTIGSTVQGFLTSIKSSMHDRFV